MRSQRAFCKIIFLFCGIAFSFSASAQSVKQYIRKADKYFESGQYFHAITYYDKAMELDSTGLSLNFHYAEANRFVNNYKIAERYYYKVWTRDNKNEFPQSQYWLGMMQKSNGKYRDAGKSFDRYYRRFSRDSSNYFTLRSKIEIASCEWALREIAYPHQFMIVHLDTNVNTIHADFGAAMRDSSELFYSSVRGDSATTIYTQEILSKLFVANGKDTSWTQSVPADSAFRFPDADVGNASFNRDFSKLYFTVTPKKKNKKITKGIYCSSIKNNKFSTPELLGSDINPEGTNNTQPSSATDSSGNEILFFASDRPGGFGKLDIWYCKVNKDGNFGNPVNAGRFVNTADDEISPFYNDSTKKLYFSSTYPKGMGGFDIYASVWKDSLLAYGKPENIGYPMNSAANELYYSSNASDRKGYFSSNRAGSYSVYGENCCNDIYFFARTDTVQPKKDSVLAVEPPPPQPPAPKEDIIEKIKLLVPLTLYFNNDEPDPKTTAVTTKLSYDETYRTYLKTKDKYKSEYAKGLKGEAQEKAENDIENFFRDELTSGFIGLENFAALMLENLEEGRVCTVTMQGYCSPLASTDYNKNLAKRRIVSLKNYFMTYGNGIFVQYMSELPNPEIKGKIIFKEEDVGELPTYDNVSDNFQDQRNSVYSRKAMMERKIQIIAISAVNK